MSFLFPAAQGAAGATRRVAVCLCAAWCNTCTAYRPVLEQAAAAFPDARFLWLDIEDEETLLGSLDVENFPTLLVAVDDDVRFYGTLTPQPETLTRLLRAAFGASTGATIDPDARELLARLRA